MKLADVRILRVSLLHGDEPLVVGRLASEGHRILFEYDATFLARGLSISPLRLPLRAGVQEDMSRTFDGLPGVFHDSLPDGWGRLLVDRHLSRSGVVAATLSPLQRLALVGRHGMGALAYEPELGESARAPELLDLDLLAGEARSVLEGAAEDVLPALLAAGGSSGGARPKVLVGWRSADNHIVEGASSLEDDHAPYIVKFRSQQDAPDIGQLELAYAAMARAAGLHVDETRLFTTGSGASYFGAGRFDRAGRRRVHMHSLGGLLHADHRTPGAADGEHLVRAVQVLTRDMREVERALRQLAFNVAAHNRDDHVKNFAFLMDEDGRWTLSPAFDLTFSDGPRGEHWMSIAGERAAPTRAHLLQVARTGGVHERNAHRIVDDVVAAVALWPQRAREAGVSSKTTLTVESRLARIRTLLKR